MKTSHVALVMLLLASRAWAQAPAPPGRAQFENRCGVCHGGDGNGGEYGPTIVAPVAARTDAQLATLIHDGLPGRGMPGTPNLADADVRDLIQFLRTLRPRPARGGGAPQATAKFNLTDGRTLEGTPTNRADADDIQLRTADGHIQLLRKSGERYRVVTSQTDWTTHDGTLEGNRYSTLAQINQKNVSKLAPKWFYTIQNTTRLETTPLVVGGVMYVTTVNECYALDAGNGREIWRFQRPRTRGLIGNAAGGINRGVAVAGDRVFMVTDNAHLLALNRHSGEQLWDTEMADWHQNYNATSAPLIVGNQVVSGTAGGEQGVRGFVASYDQSTGKELWRFWTVPKRGEPGSETWQGSGIDHPGGVTWMTGVYDAALNLVYWTTGNPSPDYNGDDRLGDNLYASSVVALDASTGQLKWYFQFTPHNVWDWDAEQPTVLIDTAWQGQPRKLLVQASRNGFFYVLDRTNGKLLLAKPFVKQLTWAREIGADGRPVLNPDQVPTEQGTKICPSSHGAANWYSTSYSPITGFYYLQALENCNIFVKSPVEWAALKNYMGGSTRQAPDTNVQKVLRAIDIKTGAIAWELPQTGPGQSRGGTMTTAGGLVFFCEDQDRFVAVDAGNGKILWQFPTNSNWRASPITYRFDDKQYIAIASGTNIVVFGLVE